MNIEIRDDLIVVDQLPVIRQRLEEVKAQTEERVRLVLATPCNKDTVKEVKKLRAELNKDFAELDNRRKAAKNAVMKPYNEFEIIYKDCVSYVFSQADALLKRRIDDVENSIKAEKRKRVEEYFDEYCKSLHIDFLTFEQSGINVTLSASLPSLKTASQAFADRVADDLALIETQEDKDEILYHYKKADGTAFLNASEAIMLVTEQHRVIEAEQERARQVEEETAAVHQSEEKVRAVVEALVPPKESKPEKTFRTTFTVVATADKLRELKQFLENGGYQYE